ncbi:TPA: hypothetical protein BOS_18862 [Bos taurus]|nr:TPA: hypothetical protein BOS_18862 [Bos taurus]
MCLLEEACVWERDVGTGLMGYGFTAVLQLFLQQQFKPSHRAVALGVLLVSLGGRERQERLGTPASGAGMNRVSLPSTSSVFAQGLTPAPSNRSNTCSAPSGPTKQLGFHRNKSSPQNLSGGRLKGATVATKASNHGARAVEYKCNPAKAPPAGRPGVEASLEAEAAFSTGQIVREDPHPNPTRQEEGGLGPSSALPPQPHPCNTASQGNHELCRIRAQRKELWVEREYSRGGREPRYRGLQPRRPASEDTHLQSGDEQGPRAGSRQIQVHSQGALFLTLAVPLLSRPSKKSLSLPQTGGPHANSGQEPSNAMAFAPNPSPCSRFSSGLSARVDSTCWRQRAPVRARAGWNPRRTAGTLPGGLTIGGRVDIVAPALRGQVALPARWKDNSLAFLSRRRGDHSRLLQQLHVARREPAAESVLLLAFPPAAVRDLQQRDELARGEAQPLAMPLPGKGVQGPAAGAGHGLGAGAHTAACIPAEPRGLGSGSAGSQAPGAPGSRALGARRLGGNRGSPGRRGTCTPRRETETRWLRRASGDAPGPGGSRLPARGGGAGLRGRRPRRRGLRRQLPGDAERGRPPRGPAAAEAALARGNAQLPGEVGPGASPSTRLRGEGGAADVERGWRPGGGPLCARGRGWAGAGPGRPRPLRAGRSLAEQAAYSGGVSRLTPPPRKAAGLETPLSARPVGRWWACASSEVPVRECVCGRHCQG